MIKFFLLLAATSFLLSSQDSIGYGDHVSSARLHSMFPSKNVAFKEIGRYGRFVIYRIIINLILILFQEDKSMIGNTRKFTTSPSSLNQTGRKQKQFVEHLILN